MMSRGKEPKYRLTDDGKWERATKVYRFGQLIYKEVDESVVVSEWGAKYVREAKRSSRQQSQQPHAKKSKLQPASSSTAGLASYSSVQQQGPSSEEVNEANLAAADRVRAKIRSINPSAKLQYVHNSGNEEAFRSRTTNMMKMMEVATSICAEMEEKEEGDSGKRPDRPTRTKNYKKVQETLADETLSKERNPQLNSADWFEVFNCCFNEDGDNQEMHQLFIKKVEDICRNEPPPDRKPWANCRGVCAYCYAHKTSDPPLPSHKIDEACPYVKCNCLSCAAMDQIRPGYDDDDLASYMTSN